MKVKCIHNKLSEFNIDIQSKITGGLKTNSTYENITLNKEYDIYGIETYSNGQVVYLLNDDYESPSWRAQQLFEIIDSTILEDWHITMKQFEGSNIEMIIGYKEMIENREHHDALLGCGESEEKEKIALELFKMYVRHQKS